MKRSVRVWSREAKISAFLAAVFLLSTGAVPALVWLVRGNVGARCVDNDDCRSRLCLDEDPSSTRFPGGAGLRIDGERGYCTDTCDRDAQCPKGFDCQSAKPFRHGDSDQREAPNHVSVCVRRAVTPASAAPTRE